MNSSTLFAVRRPLRLDAEEVADLWAYYAHSRDSAVRERLLAAYMEFARMLAAKVFAKRIFTEMEFDDYFQYARVGLIEAIDRYEPARGIKFETYASSRINGAMLNGIETCSELQQQLHARKRLVEQRVASLVEKAPEQAEAQDVFARLAEIAVGLAVGLALEESGMHVSEHAQYADNSYTSVEMKQLQSRIKEAVRALPPNQRHVITSHYLHHMAFEEVATGMSLTRGRVSQLHKQGLAGLRTLLEKSNDMDLRF
jgi:RNA polymerase sigma factor for flagellar operon FliA